MSAMNSVAFRLINYRFEKIELNLKNQGGHLNLSFNPYGEYHKSKGVYHLFFDFYAKDDNDVQVALVSCHAIFEFTEKSADIPDYFYTNSIAILFPYVRSMVSTVTLQANANPILLPTLNLSDLRQPLRDKTNIVEEDEDNLSNTTK